MLCDSVICYEFKGLQNDHKNLMKEIENGLHQLHASARAGSRLNSIQEPMDANAAPTAISAKPFMKVNRVDNDSPAFDAVLNHFWH